MEAALFEVYLGEVAFLTDDQLDSLAFQVWAAQSERYAEDAANTSLTQEAEGDTITSYQDIRGQ